jgi:hypothetical protein
MFIGAALKNSLRRNSSKLKLNFEISLLALIKLTFISGKKFNKLEECNGIEKKRWKCRMYQDLSSECTWNKG